MIIEQNYRIEQVKEVDREIPEHKRNANKERQRRVQGKRGRRPGRFALNFTVNFKDVFQISKFHGCGRYTCMPVY
jgi:hypothetical protein